MDAVIIGVPADLIAERQRLGPDTRDEVWDGEYHMVPPPALEHQRVVARLLVALIPVAEGVGLEAVHEVGLIPPEEPAWRDLRIADLVILRPEVAKERGVIGGASLVVEIRSPGDESFEKLPFFERLGVGEVLIIDRETKAVRLWANDADGLVESAGDGAGRHALGCLPIESWNEGETLVVLADGLRAEV